MSLLLRYLGTSISWAFYHISGMGQVLQIHNFLNYWQQAREMNIIFQILQIYRHSSFKQFAWGYTVTNKRAKI